MQTTAAHREMIKVTCAPAYSPRRLPVGDRPSYLAYLVSGGGPKKEGTFCNASLRSTDLGLIRVRRVLLPRHLEQTPTWAWAWAWSAWAARSPHLRDTKPAVVQLSVNTSVSRTESCALTGQVLFYLALKDGIQTGHVKGQRC